MLDIIEPILETEKLKLKGSNFFAPGLTFSNGWSQNLNRSQARPPFLVLPSCPGHIVLSTCTAISSSILCWGEWLRACLWSQPSGQMLVPSLTSCEIWGKEPHCSLSQFWSCGDGNNILQLCLQTTQWHQRAREMIGTIAVSHPCLPIYPSPLLTLSFPQVKGVLHSHVPHSIAAGPVLDSL